MDRFGILVSVAGLIILGCASLVFLQRQESPPEQATRSSSIQADSSSSESATTGSDEAPFFASEETNSRVEKRTEISSHRIIVRGRVIDAKGHPIEATVRFLDSAGLEILQEIKSQRSGEFKAVGLETLSYQVDAYGDAGLSARSYELDLSDGLPSEEIVITLGDGPVLSGEVTHPSQGLVTSATIEIHSQNRVLDPVDRRVAKTDTNGNFVFPPLRDQATYVLRVLHESMYSPQGAIQVEIRADQWLTLPLLSFSSVQGVVLDPKGSPASQATVLLDDQETTADQDGRFEISKIKGHHEVRSMKAISEDRKSKALLETLVIAPGQSLDQLVIQLESTPRVFGYVYSPEGEPIEGAQIRAQRMGIPSPYLTKDMLQNMDASLGMPRRYLSEEYLPETVSYEPFSPPSAPTIEFDLGFTVQESATAAASEWIQNVHIHDSSLSIESFIDLGALQSGAHVSPSLDWSSDEVLTTSDEHGFYEFDDLWPSPYRIFASASSFLTDDKTAQPAFSGSDISLDFYLKRAAVVSGTVRDQEGNPVKEALVAIFEQEEMRTSTMTAADGTYRLEGLTQGEYEVFSRLSSRKLVGHRVSLVVASGHRHENVDFELRLGGVLEGYVRCEGAPIRGATVHARTENDTVTRSTQADAQGFYRIEELYETEFALRATAEGHFPSDSFIIAAKMGETHYQDLEVKRPLTIEGQATLPGGEWASNVYVFLLLEGQTEQTVRTDGQGRYQLPSAKPLKYELLARSEDYRFNARVDLDMTRESERVRRDVLLRRGCTVEGMLVDGQDLPVAGVEVRGQTLPYLNGNRTARTDSQGRFRIENLYPGKTRLSLSDKKLNKSLTLELVAGETRSDLRLVIRE